MPRLLSRLRTRIQVLDRANGNGNGHARRLSSGVRNVTRARYVVTAAEAAPCTCPDFCERDHQND